MSIDRMERWAAEHSEAGKPTASTKPFRLVGDDWRIYKLLWDCQSTSRKRTNDVVTFGYPDYEKMIARLANPETGAGPCRKTVYRIVLV